MEELPLSPKQGSSPSLMMAAAPQPLRPHHNLEKIMASPPNPVSKEFLEKMLADVSVAVEHLWQHNAELIQENTLLRAESGSNVKLCEGKLKTVKTANEKSAWADTGMGFDSCAIAKILQNDMGGQGLHVDPGSRIVPAVLKGDLDCDPTPTNSANQLALRGESEDNVCVWNSESSRPRTARANGSNRSTQKMAEKWNVKYKRMAFWLETLPTFVILVNTAVTGLSADMHEYERLWEQLEFVFAGCYLIEVLVKVRLNGIQEYLLGDEKLWNWFDLACLALSLTDIVVEIFILVFVKEDDNNNNGSKEDANFFMLIKIFRLARLARLVRILRFKIFNELKMMVLGVFSGLRVLTWAIVMLVLLMYLVGVALTNIFGQGRAQEEEAFRSVPTSMFTLFRCWTEGCTEDDGTPLAEKMRQRHGAWYAIFHILMTMFVTVGVFNLIMAIFIDNVLTTQMLRKHKEMGDRSDEIEIRFKRLLAGLLHARGTRERTKSPEQVGRHLQSFLIRKYEVERDEIEEEWQRLRAKNVCVSKKVFAQWLEHEDFQNLLDDAEIETTNHFELFDVLDADCGGELSLDELTTGLMKLRGPVTKADIVAVRLKVRHLTQLLDGVREDFKSGSVQWGSTGEPVAVDSSWLLPCKKCKSSEGEHVLQGSM